MDLINHCNVSSLLGMFLITSLLAQDVYAIENSNYHISENKLTLQWMHRPELSQAYEKKLSEQVSKIWVDSKRCYVGKAESVSVIIEINQSGAVTSAWSNHIGKIGKCISDIALPVMFPNPPFKSFYMKIIMQ